MKASSLPSPQSIRGELFHLEYVPNGILYVRPIQTFPFLIQLRVKCTKPDQPRRRIRRALPGKRLLRVIFCWFIARTFSTMSSLILGWLDGPLNVHPIVERLLYIHFSPRSFHKTAASVLERCPPQSVQQFVALGAGRVGGSLTRFSFRLSLSNNVETF